MRHVDYAHCKITLTRIYNCVYRTLRYACSPPLAEPSHALIEFVKEPDSVVPVNRLRDCSTQLPQEGSECKVAWTDKKCRVLAVGESCLCHELHSVVVMCIMYYRHKGVLE